MKNFLLLISLALSLSAFANGRGGNGGTGILCTHPETGEKKVFLLDLIDMPELPTRNSKHSDFEEAERLMKIHSLEMYEPNGNNDIIKSFKLYRDSVIQDDGQSPVLEIDDISTKIPSKHKGYINCEKVFVGYFKLEEQNFYPEFYLNKSLYNLMDDRNKVGLLIHEVMYFDFVFNETFMIIDHYFGYHQARQMAQRRLELIKAEKIHPIVRSIMLNYGK